MSTFKGCISNKVLPSIPSFLTSFSPLSFLIPRALPFFRPAHKCSIVPAMVFEALFFLKWVATAPLSEFSCQNVNGSVSVTSMALLKYTSVFKFIPHYPDYCNVSSVTVNHPILFSSSNLWATQSLLHSYTLWTSGVNTQETVLLQLQFCLGLCWIRDQLQKNWHLNNIEPS